MIKENCFWGINARLWTQDFALSRQVLYHLSYIYSPFCYCCFDDRVHFFPKLVKTVIILFCTSQCHWDDRHVSQHPTFIIDMVSHKLFFCLSWPWIMILPMSASQVFRMLGLQVWDTAPSLGKLFWCWKEFLSKKAKYTKMENKSVPHGMRAWGDEKGFK
jgi:hypothetical protein